MATKPSEQAMMKAEAIALEKLGKRPSYDQIGLKESFAKMVYAFKDYDARIAVLREKREMLSDEIMKELGRTGISKIEVDAYNVTIVDQDKMKLDVDKLMEQGVDCIHCGEHTPITATDVENARVPLPHVTYVLITEKKKAPEAKKVTAIKK